MKQKLCARHKICLWPYYTTTFAKETPLISHCFLVLGAAFHHSMSLKLARESQHSASADSQPWMSRHQGVLSGMTISFAAASLVLLVFYLVRFSYLRDLQDTGRCLHGSLSHWVRLWEVESWICESSIMCKKTSNLCWFPKLWLIYISVMFMCYLCIYFGWIKMCRVIWFFSKEWT